MAIRLSKSFRGSPKSRLREHMQYDLVQAEKNVAHIKVEKAVMMA